MQSTQSLRFSRKDSQRFFKTLNQRVNIYFKENKLKKTGNWKLYLKTLVMFTLLVAPYCLVFILEISLWYKLPMCMLMGVGMAGVGMNVMHDGNHGSFSNHPWVNKLMGKQYLYFSWKRI